MRVDRFPALRFSMLAFACAVLLTAARAGTVLVGYGDRNNYTLGDEFVPSVLGAKPVASGVAAVSNGDYHQLLLRNDHTLWSVGANHHGQLGDGTRTPRATPVFVAADVAMADGGWDFTAFVKLDGTLWTTGANYFGQLGTGSASIEDQLVPVQIATGVARVACGSQQLLFIKTDGSLWGCGQGTLGQLGDGTRLDRRSPVLIATGVARAAVGSSVSYFVTVGGDLRGMGQNFYGELGLGDTTIRLTPTRIASGVAQVSAGFYFGLFVTTDGRLFGMGGNWSGQLGDGTQTDRKLPVQIATDVVSCRAGTRHSLFTTLAGEVRGMGYGWDGELATGARTTSSIPIPVATALPGTASALAAGRDWSAFLLPDGTLWASGSRQFGQLGDGEIGCSPAGQQLASEVSVAAGGVFSSAYVKTDRSLWCMGASVLRNAAVQRQIDEDAVDVALGERHVVYVKSGGALWAWGDNVAGAFGNGGTTRSDVPIAVGINDARRVAAGAGYTVYIDSADRLWGMGVNLLGQLGDGTTTNRASPVLIASGVTDVSVWEDHTLFIKNDRTLWGCGVNSEGELGTAPAGPVLTPRLIAADVSAVATGKWWTVFVTSDGSLWGTGNNGEGQLGLGNKLSTRSPVRSTVISDVARVAAGKWHVLILKTDGTVWTAGNNEFGQLGDGTVGSRSVLAQIAARATAIGAGYQHSLVVFTPPPPAIVSNPGDVIGLSGSPANLTVAANGYAPMTFQWYRGTSGDTTQPVDGGNSATMPVSIPASPTTFWVRVTGPGGSTDSAAATVAEPQTAESWARVAGVAEPLVGSLLDADGDGSLNLFEYAFRTSPKDAAQSAPPVFTTQLLGAETGLVLTHRRNKAAKLSFAYETSTDLVTWDPASPVVTVITADADGDGQAEVVQATFPLVPGTPRQFLRLRVTAP